MTISGDAAGVRYLAVPPADGATDAPVVVVWHMRGAHPADPEAAAAALPLADVRAWRVYLPLLDPGMFEAGAVGDVLLDGYGALVERTVESFPAVLAALPFGNGEVSLVGGSAGGHTALLTAIRGEVPVRALAVVNPAITVASVLTASGIDYPWTDAARELEARLDVRNQAGRITARTLLIGGESDYPAFRAELVALHGALPGSRLVTVPGMGHPIPEGDPTVDREVSAWLG
jgi:pimeloyl-ACP methyl ester carboxylesterase